MHSTRSLPSFGDVPNTRSSSPGPNIPIPSGHASMHPQTPLPLIRQYHRHIPLSAGSFSFSTRAEHENVIAYRDSSTVEGQASLLNHSRSLPQEATYLKRHNNNLDPSINFLDVYRQGRHANPETTRELYRCRQKMILKSSIRISPVLPIPDNDACQSIARLVSSGGKLGASRYHTPHSTSMGTLCPTGTLHTLENPVYSPAKEHVQRQTWGLSHSAQTSVLRKERENVSWKGVGRHYEKRITPSLPPYPSYLQLAISEYGNAPEIGLDDPTSRLSQQPVNPAVFTNIVEAGKHAQSSIPTLSKGENSKSTICSFIYDGIKHYRCECGFESASKGRMDRHRDSLRHSKRKHECSCGRFLTRADSLKRHKKNCNNQRR